MVVNDYLEKLRFLFSENLLLAALDLVDRENGEYRLFYLREPRSLIKQDSGEIHHTMGTYTVSGFWFDRNLQRFP